MSTSSYAPTAAATVRPSAQCEHLERANRVLTIKVELPKISNAVATPARLPQTQVHGPAVWLDPS
jgi:hypothetical protein